MSLDGEIEQRLPVQVVVEKPQLCVFGRSGSSIKEQAELSGPRLEDIIQCKEGLVIDGASFTVIPRFVSADYPARAFEYGQQIGGTYKCPCGIQSDQHAKLDVAFSQKSDDLDERTDKIRKGVIWKDNDLVIFGDLDKKKLVDEAKARGIPTGTSYQPATKADLNKSLKTHMKGVTRFPALLLTSPNSSMEDIGCGSLEVPNCEILHDFVGVFQNVIDEVPHHLPDETERKKVQDFFDMLKGDKDRLKGVDARRFAIRLALFCDRENINEDLTTLAKAMCEISQIAYGYESDRNPRQILRLYNLTYILATKLIKIVGHTPLKMTALKFYGIHFHGLTTHLPEVFRITSIRSLVPEQEEASFYKLRQISLHTSSRKSQNVIDNAMIRFGYNAQNVDYSAQNYKESLIRREASKVYYNKT